MPSDEEPPEIGEVEFSDDFHDLFHSILDRACTNRRVHLSHAWEFKWRPELRRHTLCRVGLHRIVKGWRRDRDEMNRGRGPWQFFWLCADCEYQPSLTVPLEETSDE